MSNGYLSAAFDLINVGDLDVISQARELCERLVVGVYTDEYVEQLAGRPPIVPLVERMDLVRHVRGVDDVVIHDHQADDRGRCQEYVVQGSPGSVTPAGARELVPRRQTTSRELLNALAPMLAIPTAERGVA